MVPYIEGEGSAALGVLAGINPVVAAVAGATGNIICVLIVVYFGSRIRGWVVARRAQKAGERATAPAPVPAAVPETVGAGSGSRGTADVDAATASAHGFAGLDATALTAADQHPADQHSADKKPSKGRERFTRWVVRFGVPGASLIGPLALPTQLTAAMLVASGVQRNWVILWQIIAILLWTTAVTLAATGIISLIVG
jgi:hypothetical protein